MIQIYITDRDLIPVGDPITLWNELDVVGRFNEPSSGSFKTPATPAVLDLMSPGNRVQIIRDGASLAAGPIEIDDYGWSVGDDPGEQVVRFADDFALIAGRGIYPDPTAVATAQTATAAYTSSGVGATVLRDLVNKNAGPGALAVRRVSGLALGDGSGLGTSTSITARFEPLGDVLRTVAKAGGGLGFRTRQSGQTIFFDVYQPADLSSTVRFSRGLRNLRSVSFVREAPKTTVAHVAGQGEGTARTIREVVSSQATTWWRLETFIDQRQTNVAAELDAAGTEAVTSGGETAKLATVTVDTPTQRYGTHYQLGDKVAIEIYPGLQITDVVRAFHLQASPESGELVTSVIGSQEASRDPGWIQQNRDFERRLGRLERR